MTALFGVFGTAGAAPLGDDVAQRMLRAMARRGSAQAGLWRQGAAVLGVERQGWEFGPGFSGPVLAVEDGDCVVVADASLYYRDDLRRRLAAEGVRPRGQTASHLILAAYRAWGEECAEYLEGDFAFVLYDRRSRRVLAARDFVGHRPLYYAEVGDTLVVASTIGGVLAHPGCSQELDLAALGIDASGLIYSGTGETCFRDVATVRAGHTISRGGSGQLRLARWWNPVVRAARKPTSLADGAAELRAAIGHAVSERLDPSVPTALWMSGGYDSTAVFGAGQHMLAGAGEGDRLRPVSVSYPEGDPGREDERIAAIAEFWSSPVHWLDSGNLPLIFDDAAERAGRRDEPFAHLYELWMRQLVKGSRELEARVVLNGYGGDFLFQSTPVVLADLVSKGRFIRAAREWRAMGVRNAPMQHLFHWAVQPLLPQPALQLAERTRGRRFEGYFERPVPTWLAERFVRTHDVAERARAGAPRWPGANRSAHEMHWYLTQPHGPRVSRCASEYALDGGVEMRSPLFDGRVIRLAAARPREERNSFGETKRLVRRAMHGLLPEEALAWRRIKTGTLAGYYTRSMREAAPLFAHAFKAPLLAELGIVDAERLRRESERYFRHGGVSFVAEQLLSTLQAELWLRARESAPAAEGTMHTHTVCVAAEPVSYALS